MSDKTMIECSTQEELLAQFKKHIDFTPTIRGAFEWSILFMHAYISVIEREAIVNQMAIQYEYQQKLDALTGGDK